VNLIDGLDGLAAGIVAIACTALWATGRRHGDFYVMFIASLLIGACVGFLWWNRPPARVFMGDTGSQFLGLTLSALSLLESRKGTAAITLLLPIVALGVPIADSVLAFVRRLWRGKHVFRGDAGHIHHRLLDAGLSPRAALATLWGLSLLCAAAAVVLEFAPHRWTLPTTVGLGAVLFAVVLAARHRARRRAAGPSRPDSDVDVASPR
jgi:UDP-GlcNAc:undecaprenyl-phosphate GlcNAc-1-phosphate transferase